VGDRHLKIYESRDNLSAREASKEPTSVVIYTGTGTRPQVVKVDVTGAVFTCAGGTTYTVTSGTAIAVFHESTDATGGMHVTGTIAPTGVKLASSADNLTYRLAGASWFGGNFGSGGGTATDTEHFQIIGPSGGVVASVSIVSHFTVTAQGVVTVEFEKNTGACTPPED